MIDPATIPDRNCNGADRELFFPANNDGIAYARRICRGCPVIDACLEFALTIEADTGRSGRFGIYGGTSPRQRHIIAAMRRAA